MFFVVAISGMLAVIIFSGVIVLAPQARAYAVGAVSTDTTTGTGTTSGYNFGDSLQGLISPFTGFISNLKLNNNTTIDAGAQTPTHSTVNVAPAVDGGIQNTVSQWLGQFDNWFYGVSGVRLSGIFYVLLNALAWTLGLAQRVVDWLLGLFQ